MPTRRSLPRRRGAALYPLLLLAAFLVPCGWGTPAVGQLAARLDNQPQQLFDDFIHFARLGKFAEAEAFAAKLLDEEGVTGADLLMWSDANREAVPTLLTMIAHTSMRDTAQRMLDLIREGEFEQRQDEERILANVALLSGSPQEEYHALQRLMESGEYAVPDLLAVLLDDQQAALHPRVIRALPQMGKSAVNPLVIALQVADDNTRRNLIDVLGEIGYPQATPYMLERLNTPGIGELERAAIGQALERIHATSDRRQPADPVLAFLRLGNQYYDEIGSVKADPRLPRANVWYLEDGSLIRKVVPTSIFGAVMAMRCAAEALELDADNTDAMALWLAANFRREARLGMDVESAEADAGADADPTRPEGFPRSIYFAQAAGAEYCHLVLTRAVRDNDRAVALGAIAALDVIAGPASLVGSQAHQQAFSQALQFPDPEVRIKAAIAAARSLPSVPFRNANLVGIVLAEGLSQQAEAQVVVAVADDIVRNRIAGGLREQGADVVAEGDFNQAMSRARRELSNISGIVLGTDIEQPSVVSALAEIRNDYLTSRTPVAILVRRDQTHRAEQAMSQSKTAGTVQVDSRASTETLREAIANQYAALGIAPMDDDLADELALRTAEALHGVALDPKTVIDPLPAVPALLRQVGGPDETLRLAAAEVLAQLPVPEGQQAIADLALNGSYDAEHRIAGFDILAIAARRHGNHLREEQVDDVVAAARDIDDLVLRTAASQALGALNLRRNAVSAIVRSYDGN